MQAFEFYITLFYGFLFAISLGSFYITLAERILHIYYGPMRKQTSRWQRTSLLLFRPSACFHCGYRIRFLELTPVLGYFFARKKCSGCGRKLSSYYPIFELAFGVFFLLCYLLSYHFSLSIAMVLLLGHTSISMFTDLKKFSLDYENLPFIIAIGILTNYLIGQTFPGTSHTLVFFGFLFFYIILYLLFPRGIGLGDVLFAPFFSFLCGHPWWMFFLNSSYIFAVLFSFVFRDKSKSFRSVPIPMGLYFSLGLLLTYLVKILYHFHPHILNRIMR